ncbi:TPA: hypothetical protein ACX6QO_002135 [Photobacterium damselae]
MNIFKFCYYVLLCIPFLVEANTKNELPSSYKIRELMQSYSNNSGIIGENIAYIPVDKPCLNVLSKGINKEFCFINENENLAKSNGAGFYISLKDVDKETVYFDYHTMWYDMRCSYSTSDKKPECEQPNTN